MAPVDTGLFTQNLVQQFDVLSEQLASFCDLIQTETSQAWLLNHNPESAIKGCRRAFTDLWYQDGQDGRETRTFPGLLSATEAMIEQGERVNQCKTDFQHSVQALRKQDEQAWLQCHRQLPERGLPLRHHFQHTDLSRLHLKQCYRHIPILPSVPINVGFSWYTSGKSIKKINKKQALALLEQLNVDADHIRIQIDKLAAISDHEILAQMQTLAPTLRANLVYKDEDDHIERKAMNIALPILVPSRQLPNFKAPSNEPPKLRTRNKRNDIKLEETAYLPSIRVYRYTQPSEPA